MVDDPHDQHEEKDAEAYAHDGKKALVAAIVDSIRLRIVALLLVEVDGDPWDELVHGVNWLDKEIGFFNDLWHCLDVLDVRHVQSRVGDCDTVLEVQDLLLNYSDVYLGALLHVMQSGGTDNAVLFAARQQVRDLVSPLMFPNVV
jgi:hypothetical protein